MSISAKDKIRFRKDGTNWKADVVSMNTDGTICANVQDDNGYIMFGVKDAKIAATPEDRNIDGFCWPI